MLYMALKMSIEELDLILSRMEFGAATANILLPYVFSLAFGVAKQCLEDNLSVHLEV